MTDATTKAASYKVRYDRTAAAEGGDAWDLLDADGDHVDSFGTRAEARAYAAELVREAKVEALRDRIETALGDCDDLKALRKIAALLART